MPRSSNENALRELMDESPWGSFFPEGARWGYVFRATPLMSDSDALTLLWLHKPCSVQFASMLVASESNDGRVSVNVKPHRIF